MASARSELLPLGLVVREKRRAVIPGHGQVGRRRQEVQHHVRGAAELDALVRDHDRPVEQDRLLLNGSKQIVVALGWIAQPESRVGRALVAQNLAYGHAHAVDQPDQLILGRWRFEVLDDLRLDPVGTDEIEGAARGAALRVVVDLHGHRLRHGSASPSTVQQAARTLTAGVQTSGRPWQQSCIRKAIRPDRAG